MSVPIPIISRTAYPQKQTGVALLAFILILLVASSAMLLHRLSAETTNPWERAANDIAILNEAKQALIAFAVHYPFSVKNPPDLDDWLTSTSENRKGPGRLPCPNLKYEGINFPSCSFGGNNTNVGWLPWEGIGVSELRDTAGQRLWYSINNSNRFIQNRLNANTPNPDQNNGLGDYLSIVDTNGNTIAEDIVAVVIAPGPPLPGQSRPTNPADSDIIDYIADYLECDNQNLGNDNFQIFSLRLPSLDNECTGNDTLVFIQHDELMAVVKQVVEQICQSLDIGAPTPPWFEHNQWNTSGIACPANP